MRSHLAWFVLATVSCDRPAPTQAQPQPEPPSAVQAAPPATADPAPPAATPESVAKPQATGERGLNNNANAAAHSVASNRVVTSPPTTNDDEILAVLELRNPPAPNASCSERAEYSQQTLAQAQNAAKPGCNVDSDCVSVSLSSSCRGACPMAISKRFQVKYEQLRTNLENSVCKGYREQDNCSYVGPRCIVGAPRCLAGVCESVRETK